MMNNPIKDLTKKGMAAVDILRELVFNILH